MPEATEIFSATKNMFLPQARKEPIVQIEVVVKVLQEVHTAVVEEAQTVRLDPVHQAVDQAVFPVHPEVQAEALACQVEAAVVVHQPHHQVHRQENNLKKSYYESKNTFGYTIPMQFCDISTIIKLC